MVGVMFINMLFNFMIIFQIGFKGVYLILVKYGRRFIKKCKDCCGPENLEEL